MKTASHFITNPKQRKNVAGVLALATLAIAGLLALGVWGITTNNTEAAPGMTTTPPDYLSVSNIGDTHAKLTLANSSSEADVDEWYFKIASTNPQGRCEGPITKGEKGTDISIILDGLTFDASSRQLSGTPSATGNSSCTYTASATGLTDATLTFSISVVESKSLSFGNSAVPAQTYSKDKQIATLQLPAATGPPTTYP